MQVRPSGIISYAGFDKATLWIQARQAFIQAEDVIPKRFASFLPLFPMELIQTMPYVGASNNGFVTEDGFSLDPSIYHRMLHEQMPELYEGDNHSRSFDYEGRFVGRGVLTVDRAWVTAFPQYQPFQGERLAIYMIGGGPQAVAVPESVYPRGRGVLHSAEADMRVSARSEHYRTYVLERVLQGEAFDSARFESEYLEENQLEPVVIRQSELGRVMQDLAILKNLREEPEAAGLFTENAKRAEHIPQYTPWLLACDTFDPSATTRNTARLIQLHYAGDDFVSDFWLPYQDAMVYLNRQTMTMNIRALCEGFQLPPRYDPVSRGGLYPDRVRVAVVRDRNLRPMVADALNNPAYGSGMGPMGLINKRVLLRDSRELLRQKKLTLEAEAIRCEHTELPAREYRDMLQAAALQECAGALIDAMYRRESALSQINEQNPGYQRARELLNQRVAALETRLAAQSQQKRAQLSGYDADIDYLRRMEENREGVEDEEQPKPLPFSHNALRMISIESGYAMRSGIYSCRYEDIALLEESEPLADETDAELDAETQSDGDGDGANEASGDGDMRPDGGAEEAGNADEAGEAAHDSDTRADGGADEAPEAAHDSDTQADSSADEAGNADEADEATDDSDTQTNGDTDEATEVTRDDDTQADRGADNAYEATEATRDSDTQADGNADEADNADEVGEATDDSDTQTNGGTDEATRDNDAQADGGADNATEESEATHGDDPQADGSAQADTQPAIDPWEAAVNVLGDNGEEISGSTQGIENITEAFDVSRASRESDVDAEVIHTADQPPTTVSASDEDAGEPEAQLEPIVPRPSAHRMNQLTYGGGKPPVTAHNPSGKMAELLKKQKR